MATLPPRCPNGADMERFSTMAALDMQGSIVAPIYSKIYAAIFDTDVPIRKTELTGIQLTENLNLKQGQKNNSRNKKLFIMEDNENE